MTFGGIVVESVAGEIFIRCVFLRQGGGDFFKSGVARHSLSGDLGKLHVRGLENAHEHLHGGGDGHALFHSLLHAERAHGLFVAKSMPICKK